MDTWCCMIMTAVTASALFISSAIADVNCTDVRHTSGPLITPCKNEFILKMGQNFTLTCKGKNEIEFKQQEGPEESLGNFNITKETTFDPYEEFPYQIIINLYNVDQYAIGYYACWYTSVNRDFINQIVMEPKNTEYVTYTYIYVEGTDSLFAPMREVVMPRSNMVVIECRPTTPDIQVSILADIPDNAHKWYSPKVGFVLDSDVLTDQNGISIFNCGFKKQDRVDRKFVFVKHLPAPPEPTVIAEHTQFLEGETFSLNCTVDYQNNFVVNLSWIHPNPMNKNIIYTTNTYEAPSGGKLYCALTIVNATEQDAGTYTCVSRNNCGEKERSIEKTFLAESKLILSKEKKNPFIESKQRVHGMIFILEAYPPATYYFQKDNTNISTKGPKYEERYYKNTHQVKLSIRNTSITDSGLYTIFATNGLKNSSATYDIRFIGGPIISNFRDTACVEGMQASLVCHVLAYPLANVTWSFADSISTEIESDLPSDRIDTISVNKVTAYLDIKDCRRAGNITCKAVNKYKEQEFHANETRNLYVFEMLNGFGINSDKVIWYPEYKDVSVRCLASKYLFHNVTWFSADEDVTNFVVEYTETKFSRVATLKIYDISLNYSGVYKCIGWRNDNTTESDSIEINVEALNPPVITQPPASKEQTVEKRQRVHLNCLASGVPKPVITWTKDGVKLGKNISHFEIINSDVNRTTVNSTINIEMQPEFVGKYKCIADNDIATEEKLYSLVLKADPVTKYLIAIAVIVLVLMILVAYLLWKVKKEKQFRKELAAAGLLYFKEGVTKSLNPELGIDEQAELLPYDDRFEFPPEKLKLGKQLGAGAFGVVYKAEARGIINAEETTPVAVKMVKKTADNMYIKALASELKIMVHLGKHINIVNLLGACTKNVGKRELVVIVEYCKFGNIHNYIMRHRDVFIDQLTDNNKEKNLGKVNQAFSCTGSTGTQSDYFGCTNTQETDHTFVNSGNTNRSGRKTSAGYVQPEWRSNYESDYSYEGRALRPFTSRDLLCWAFQIARGMEYLSSRKVLHGDLAARNVLLAEDNIVKICDFGLARSIYKNDEYQKKENSPLPVKWLAIECMTDRIFSTQSDVWSFGIVLWEMFSLAKTPYPNISPTDLLRYLSEGHRLDKPAYADDRLYDVMRKCWEQKPNARPTFTQLQELLGTFLEDNVRAHYVDLNTAFAVKDPKAPDHEDYLAMMSAPDYNNLVTPSPHHYVNETSSFFPPTPSKVDEEGYLQMSPSNKNIFSPRPASNKFDFDPRKCNLKPSEGSCGSELTPMLTLNNLAARSGSESDHEGNEGNSPYMNMCPKIEEEADEVFDTRQIKNHATNLMYITLDKDIEKKPNNNYVNINVPNGLVK